SSGEGAGLAAERQVIEADVDQIAEPAVDLGEKRRRAGRDGRLALEPLDPGESVGNRELRDRGEIEPADPYGERLGPETASAAGAARRVSAVAGEEDPDVGLVPLPLEPPKEALDAGEAVLPARPRCIGRLAVDHEA